MFKSTRKVIVSMDGKLWTIPSLADFFNETESWIKYQVDNKDEILGHPVHRVGVATSHMYFLVKTIHGMEYMRGTASEIAKSLVITEQNVWDAAKNRRKVLGKYTIQSLGSKLFYNGEMIEFQ